MNKVEIRNIIELALKSGNKMPGMFDLPKILGIKAKLESCSSISDVVGLLENNRGLLTKSFGLSERTFDETIAKLNFLRDMT